ncbi:small subunit processome component 20 homolog [Thunnus albacares]|uniref:small subunit processome component 20 homolog n=1 Tax=Thunnus albacares TaxID=8236 RepID=UPI001CF60B9F|nr:small subunit processome component 20 homolog [Thunnus albacares]
MHFLVDAGLKLLHLSLKKTKVTSFEVCPSHGRPAAGEDIQEEQDEKGADQLLFSYLTLITKLNKYCSLLELSKPHNTLCRIRCKD